MGLPADGEVTMAELPRPPTIRDILEEHLSEFGDLWEQRERSIFSPEWTLQDLSAHEARAEAHLDGLRIAAANSIDLARPALLSEEPGLAIAATFVLTAFGVPEFEREVLQALSTSPPKARNGIRIGLRHCDVTRVVPVLVELATSSTATPVRAAALDVVAFHRLPPPKGIPTLFGDPNPEVRRLAFDAAGRFGGPWSYDVLRDALDGELPELRIAALRASARMGLPGLDESCRQAGTRAHNPVPEALEFLGALGDPKDVAVFQNMMSHPALATAALSALGKLGFVAGIAMILEAIGDDDRGRAAAAAFARMTGASGLEDQGASRAWWEQEKDRFAAVGRWQSGIDVSKSPLGQDFDAMRLDARLDVYLGARARQGHMTPDRELEQKSATALPYARSSPAP